MIYESCYVFEAQIIEDSSMRQGLCEQDLILVPVTLKQERICSIGNRVCFSKAELARQVRSHDTKLVLQKYFSSSL